MARILSFPGAGPETPGGPPRVRRNKPTPWNELVELSPWWRVADCLVGELAEGQRKLSPTGELPGDLVALAWRAFQRQPETPPDAGEATGEAPEAESAFPELVKIRAILEAQGLLLSTKRNIELAQDERPRWEPRSQLWPLLWQALRQEMPRQASRQPGAGRIFEKRLPECLGFLLALAERPVAGDRLADQLEPILSFTQDLKAAGFKPLPASELHGQLLSGQEAAALSQRQPSALELDWFRLVLLDFALPLGLVRVDGASRSHVGRWTPRSQLAVQTVKATALLAAL